ncbi:hypothetical protein FVE85_3256 [Porphyridium purpureum]|uniref:Uncharacterized protein n=1 Tax=Porphyridium purpureum TaxID=35688 RepID=A0A5J4YUT4_PORPP|nr:hypothetical protein FVE85_3256 [Porphyridium purpureum]|eukprot:POR7726..scf227_4
MASEPRRAHVASSVAAKSGASSCSKALLRALQPDGPHKQFALIQYNRTRSGASALKSLDGRILCVAHPSCADTTDAGHASGADSLSLNARVSALDTKHARVYAFDGEAWVAGPRIEHVLRLVNSEDPLAAASYTFMKPQGDVHAQTTPQYPTQQARLDVRHKTLLSHDAPVRMVEHAFCSGRSHGAFSEEGPGSEELHDGQTHGQGSPVVRHKQKAEKKRRHSDALGATDSELRKLKKKMKREKKEHRQSTGSA